MDEIKLIWSRFPTFYHAYYEASNDALLSFDGFIPSSVFDLIKPYWEGYAMRSGKKTAVYRPDMAERLLNETFSLDLDGAKLSGSVAGFPGTLPVNKLISASGNSTLEKVRAMSNKQMKIAAFLQIKRDVHGLFLKSEIGNGNCDESEWTTIEAPYGNGESCDFNLSLGLMRFDGRSKTGSEKRIAKLKDDSSLEDLIKLVMEMKQYGQHMESLLKEDYKAEWRGDFDSSSFSPRGMKKE